MANTVNRGYPLPVDTKSVKEEIENLQQQVLPMIDGDIHALFLAIAGLAPLEHTHAIADITGLQAALDGKMAANVTFDLAGLTDVVGVAAAPDGYILVKVGDQMVAQSALSALGDHSHAISDVTGLDDALVALTDGVNAAVKKSSITVSTAAPSGGVDGDVWRQVDA